MMPKSYFTEKEDADILGSKLRSGLETVGVLMMLGREEKAKKMFESITLSSYENKELLEKSVNPRYNDLVSGITRVGIDYNLYHS